MEFLRVGNSSLSTRLSSQVPVRGINFLREDERHKLISHRISLPESPGTGFSVIVLNILRNNFFPAPKINDSRGKNLYGQSFCKLILRVSLKRINNIFCRPETNIRRNLHGKQMLLRYMLQPNVINDATSLIASNLLRGIVIYVA